MSAASLAACHACGLVQDAGSPEPGTAAVCPRCGEEVRRRKTDSARRTLCLALAALCFYVPANLCPLAFVFHNRETTSVTLWSSVTELFRHRQFAVGLLVFVTSILTPALKLLSLVVLGASAGSPRLRRTRAALYRFVELVNPWNMLEIFMLAMVVGIVKFGEAAEILPGDGAWAFGVMVVLTILASQTFDPRLIWDEEDLT
jgi:paraquat-inducible protein A